MVNSISVDQFVLINLLCLIVYRQTEVINQYQFNMFMKIVVVFVCVAGLFVNHCQAWPTKNGEHKELKSCNEIHSQFDLKLNDVI